MVYNLWVNLLLLSNDIDIEYVLINVISGSKYN